MPDAWNREERQQWLEQAMVKYEESLLRLCFAYLRDKALAEDAVQETFLKAYRGYSGFQGRAEEKTWLTRIAMNTCRDVRRTAWFRHAERSVSLDQLPPPVVPFSPRDDALVRAVMALARKYREVILLHYYQALSVQEIADALRLSRSTVYNRLQKAQKTLRDKRKEWYDDEP